MAMCRILHAHPSKSFSLRAPSQAYNYTGDKVSYAGENALYTRALFAMLQVLSVLTCAESIVCICVYVFNAIIKL